MEEAGTPGLPQHLSHLEGLLPVRASAEEKPLCPGRAYGCLPLRCEGEWGRTENIFHSHQGLPWATVGSLAWRREEGSCYTKG